MPLSLSLFSANIVAMIKMSHFSVKSYDICGNVLCKTRASGPEGKFLVRKKNHVVCDVEKERGKARASSMDTRVIRQPNYQLPAREGGLTNHHQRKNSQNLHFLSVCLYEDRVPA